MALYYYCTNEGEILTFPDGRPLLAPNQNEAKGFKKEKERAKYNGEAKAAGYSDEEMLCRTQSQVDAANKGNQLNTAMLERQDALNAATNKLAKAKAAQEAREQQLQEEKADAERLELETRLATAMSLSQGPSAADSVVDETQSLFAPATTESNSDYRIKELEEQLANSNTIWREINAKLTAERDALVEENEALKATVAVLTKPRPANR